MWHYKRSPLPDYTPKKIKIEDAVGSTLAHDITEIRPGEYKGPSFRKGHKVDRKDLCHLMRLGKRHLYVLDLDKEQIHEDNAALQMATDLAGPGITFDRHPKEGKVRFRADYEGLFKVNVEPLIELNMIHEIMCASIHNNTPVKKGQLLAGTRAIPLVININTLNHALGIARSHYPVLSVKVFNPLKAKLIITGNEVFDGLIEDKFEAVVTEKVSAFGASLVAMIILPDDKNMIAESIRSFLNDGTELIITTGGMSVDPDDVTKLGIRDAGVDQIYYGAGVLPGAMFLLAYKGHVPIIGIPACALYHKITIFDLILPRLLAGEKPDNKDFARLAHGGLCLDCPTCSFPACSFGKI
ncbi:MAG: molybdopterin-binding protein [Desulfobacterales bacterium]|nr:MAG: molybdopterin-binding protein [Desulfobacterales bacterium]